jgi:hypothetical protein
MRAARAATHNIVPDIVPDIVPVRCAGPPPGALFFDFIPRRLPLACGNPEE